MRMGSTVCVQPSVRKGLFNILSTQFHMERDEPPQKMIKRAMGRKYRTELKIKELFLCLCNVLEAVQSV